MGEFVGTPGNLWEFQEGTTPLHSLYRANPAPLQTFNSLLRERPIKFYEFDSAEGISTLAFLPRTIRQVSEKLGGYFSPRGSVF